MVVGDGRVSRVQGEASDGEGWGPEASGVEGGSDGHGGAQGWEGSSGRTRSSPTRGEHVLLRPRKSPY